MDALVVSPLLKAEPKEWASDMAESADLMLARTGRAEILQEDGFGPSTLSFKRKYTRRPKTKRTPR